MQSFLNRFSMHNMNQMQRQGLFFALTLAAIVLFLHFPFDGYTVQHSVITRYGTGQCPYFGTIEEINKLTTEETDRIFKQYRTCNSESELQLKSFVDWTSDSPVVPWFGSVIHALVTLLFVGGLGIAWFFLFRNGSKTQTFDSRLHEAKADARVNDKEAGL